MHQKTTLGYGRVGRKFYWRRILDLMASRNYNGQSKGLSHKLKVKVHSQERAEKIKYIQMLCLCVCFRVYI
jgi:hypothetical protein